jgi:integrase
MSDETPRTPKSRRVGSKRKLGPEKWLLRIFRGYDAEHKRIYYSEIFLGGSKLADDRLMELYNRQKAGLPLKFEPKMFKDFFNEWIEERDDGERRECTIEKYREVGRDYLLPAFGKFMLADITDVAIQRFYKDLRKRGLAQATLHNIHVLLKNIFKLATKRELIIQNPMNNVDGPGKPKPRPVAMIGEQAEAYINAAGSHPDGFMFEFALYLGARPCEYMGLMWTDLNGQGEIKIQRSLKWRLFDGWYVTPTKTDKSTRTIELTPYYIKRLEDHRRRQLEMKLKAGPEWTDHGFIFTDDAGEPFRFDKARRLHKKILAAAGLPETFKMKGSRHSCATALLAAGVDIKTVSERLGHSSIAVTMDVYTVVEKQLQRKASEALEKAFGIGKK